MRRAPDIRSQTVRQIAALVRSEAFTLGAATEELERRKRMGATLDADEVPPAQCPGVEPDPEGARRRADLL